MVRRAGHVHATMYLFIVETSRELLVNILVIECSWSPKSCAEVIIKTVGAPKCPAPALNLYLCHGIRVSVPITMQAQGKDQPSNGPKQTPAVVDSRLG